MYATKFCINRFGETGVGRGEVSDGQAESKIDALQLELSAYKTKTDQRIKSLSRKLNNKIEEYDRDLMDLKRITGTLFLESKQRGGS